MEPEPSVHNPPSRRLHHWRHPQRNFMIAHFQINNDRSPCHVASKHTKATRLACLETLTRHPSKKTLLCPSGGSPITCGCQRRTS